MRINLLMTLSIVFLDMFELRRLPKSGHIPVQMPQPLVQRRKPGSDVTDVAFEMLDVDGVEADDGRVEADVCFGDVGSEVVGCGVFCEVGFGAVEGGEEGADGFFVGFLCAKGEGFQLWKELIWGGKGEGRVTWRIRICRRRCLCRYRSSHLYLRFLLEGARGRGLVF